MPRFHRRNPGVSAFAFVFSVSFLLSSCSSTKLGTSNFEGDTYIGSLFVEHSFGHFKNAQSIAVDGFGDVYVVDADAPGVYKFTSVGDSLRAAVGIGSKHGEFDSPAEIDASLTNSVAIADRNNHRIEIYSRDLIWQATIEGHVSGSEIKFGFPSSVRAGSSGYYYIMDVESTRLLAVNPSRGTQQVIGTSGSAISTSLNAQSIAIDGSEYIDVADINSHSLLQFNNAFTITKQIGYPAVSDIRLYCNGDDLVVCNPSLNTIRLFDFHDLAYRGSYSVPRQAKKIVMVAIVDQTCYILTKERVIVCSISPKP